MNNKHEQVDGGASFYMRKFSFFQVSHLEIFSLVENIFRCTAHVYFFLRFIVDVFFENVTGNELRNVTIINNFYF